MEHPIEPHAGGKVNLSQPQQRWHATDETGLMATAKFAGHSLEATTDDRGGFDLTYLGFQATGFASMTEAKQAAPGFARHVLQRLQQLIVD